MSEYIDKDALYKEILLLENCKRELAEEKEIDEYAFLKRQQVLEVAIYYKQFVANFPTADVAPVVHGRWNGYTTSAFYGTDDFGEPIYRDATFYCCSICNRKSIIKEKFCPNCGAKCDLEG